MSDSISTLPQIDIEAIADRCKRAWLREEIKHVTVQERIALSVPWWLIIIAVSLFALSAGHTTGVFNQLSPVGFVGPLVVEFVLLWAAFGRVVGQEEKASISGALRVMEILAFIVALVANAIGAISRVATESGVASKSFEEIVKVYGTLPIPTQAYILIVPLFALFIPVGTWVAGEGIASLFMRQRKTGGHLEERWRDVEQEQMRRALYAEFIRHMTSQEARTRAAQLSASYTRGQRTLVRGRTATDIKQVAASVQKPVRLAPQSLGGRRADARFVVRAYLEQSPEAKDMSVRELARTLGVGKTIAAEELAAFKAKH